MLAYINQEAGRHPDTGIATHHPLTEKAMVKGESSAISRVKEILVDCI